MKITILLWQPSCAPNNTHYLKRKVEIDIQIRKKRINWAVRNLSTISWASNRIMCGQSKQSQGKRQGVQRSDWRRIERSNDEDEQLRKELSEASFSRNFVLCLFWLAKRFMFHPLFNFNWRENREKKTK